MFRRLKKEFSSKLSPHEAEAFSPESPTWCSSKPTKRIKTYGRKRHLRPSLQETTNTTFTNAKNDVSEVTGFEPVPVEPLVEVQQVTAANTKVRRQEKKSTRRDSKFGVQLQGSQARADAKAAREREEMLAKRRAEDEAIEENDRAEREAEVKRARLYSDWQEAKEKGWVIHEVEVQEIHRDTSNLATRRDKEHRRVKRCKMDAEAVEEAIRQLVVERERAWWDFYKSVEGLSLAEKQEMRKIRWAKWKNVDYNAWSREMASKRSAKEPAGCLYCDADDCKGC